MKIILASQSPRRRQLLEEAGYSFLIVPPEEGVETPPYEGEAPEDTVCRSARQKGENVRRRILSGAVSLDLSDSPALVLACDTIALCHGEILGKPSSRDDARRMLRLLNGAVHEVLSGLYLFPLFTGVNPVDPVSVERTRLRMESLSEEQIESYLDSGLWKGKAGAFGYQDGNDWVRLIQGSESNVIGLPMEALDRRIQTLFS